ncbi:Elongator subunit elp4 [Podochytrium sp. JEL0797]|nr:Elongator subunit elp4 [Podochytrium sp. JEL0797]
MSSFRKAGASNSLPALGTRISGLTGSTPVCSSGIASLDGSVGDMALGTVTLVLSDRGSGYASLIAKYFAAQGVASANVLCCAGVKDQEAFVNSLMLNIKDEDAASTLHDDDEGDSVEVETTRVLGSLRQTNNMTIAWRYNNLPNLNAAPKQSVSKPSGPYCCSFDITKTISTQTLNASQIALINVQEWIDENPLATASELYDKLLAALTSILTQGKFRASDTPMGTPNLLRIILNDLASPQFGIDAGSPASMHAFVSFCTRLRGVMKGGRVVCVVTVPGYLYEGHHVGVGENAYMRMAMHACDVVMEVESFSGSKRIFGDHFTSEYHGFLHIHKLSPIHTLTPSACSKLSPADIHSLAFKARRKRFLVEPFRLPPEKDEVAEAAVAGKGGAAEVGRKVSKSIGSAGGGGCGVKGHSHAGVGTQGSSLLDF